MAASSDCRAGHGGITHPGGVSRRELTTVSEFSVKAGETVPFVLTYDASHLPLPKPIDPERALAETEASGAIGRSRKYDGEYRDLVQRSLITLKALTYRPPAAL